MSQFRFPFNKGSVLMKGEKVWNHLSAPWAARPARGLVACIPGSQQTSLRQISCGLSRGQREAPAFPRNSTIQPGSSVSRKDLKRARRRLTRSPRSAPDALPARTRDSSSSLTSPSESFLTYGVPDLPDYTAFAEKLLESSVERPSVQEGLLNYRTRKQISLTFY